VRGLGTGVDIGAAAPKPSRFGCRQFLLGRKCHRLVWCAASGPMCSVWGISVRASARGLGTSVDVGTAASKSSSCGVSSLPARADGSSARVVRGLGVDVSRCGVSVFVINWSCRFVCPLIYPCICFQPVFH
jgi:hypothetical protein